MVICNCLFTSETTEMKDFYKILSNEGLVEGSRADKGNVMYDFFIKFRRSPGRSHAYVKCRHGERYRTV